jgi:EPS-associated MarR family transcriptional regulator
MLERLHKPSVAQQEAHFKVLRAIHANPSLSQRELSKELGISLGKANYCVKALLEQGWIKSRNFKNSNNKIAYTYLLTPKGIEQKLTLTMAFLKARQQEFEVLSREIQQLKQETTDKQ